MASISKKIDQLKEHSGPNRAGPRKKATTVPSHGTNDQNVSKRFFSPHLVPQAVPKIKDDAEKGMYQNLSFFGFSIASVVSSRLSYASFADSFNYLFPIQMTTKLHCHLPLVSSSRYLIFLDHLEFDHQLQRIFPYPHLQNLLPLHTHNLRL